MSTAAPAPARPGRTSPPSPPAQRGAGNTPVAARPGGTGGTLADALRDRLRSTPGRLTAVLAVLVLLGLGAGLASVIGVESRGGAVEETATHSGPLTVQAQLLYRSMSDADATAASAYLSGGVEPAALRSRYLADIDAATKALAALGASPGGATDAVRALNAGLPGYTGLVETARVYNRQNLPLGAAYLREASGLMSTSLLPNAQKVYQAETTALDTDRDSGGGVPWLALALGVLVLVGLIGTQRYLSRHTHRTFNVGLLTATAAGVVLVLWLGLSWTLSSVNLSEGKNNGSAQVKMLSDARIAALQARADESLTLVAHGGSGDRFDVDFGRKLAALDGKGGALDDAEQNADPATLDELRAVRNDLTAWRSRHKALRDNDDNGRFPLAVQAAIGHGDASTADVSADLDKRLGRAIDDAQGTFTARAGSAGDDLTGAGVGTGILAVVLLGGTVMGIQRRVAEYR